MKKLASLISLCAFCTSSVFAIDAPQMRIRTIEQSSTAKELFLSKRHQAGIAKGTIRQTAEVTADAKIWEDFEKFSQGSETSPTSDEINTPQGTIPSQYTQMPG